MPLRELHAWQKMLPQNRQWCRRSRTESNATLQLRPMHRAVVLSLTQVGGADGHGLPPSPTAALPGSAPVGGEKLARASPRSPGAGVRDM